MSIHKKSTGLQSSKVKLGAQVSKHMNLIITNISKWMLHSLVVACFGTQLALAADNFAQIPNIKLPTTTHPIAASFPATNKPEASKGHQFRSANFEQESASQDARQIADWVVNSNNNDKLPFVIIDKKYAKVFAFTPDGNLRGAAPVLLGLSHADDNVPGIGSKKLSAMPVNERTTPAGRFVSFVDTNLRGEEILWVDYDSSVALHRVHTHNLKERRGERLASPTIADNRISFGCINVPIPFYLNVISPTFKGTKGIVYVLPETKTINEVFAVHGFSANSKVASSK